MSFNIPKIPAKRVVVVGGGFGGLRLCRTLAKNPDFQVVLIDQNNFHQFPPLIYQIATAGLQVSSIAFPFRKMFDDCKNVYFRMCELRAVYPKERYIQTSIGKLDYDYLVIATGTTTNYFGNQRVQDESMPMKTISESMGLRNALLETFERANTCASAEERAELLNVVIVGGGPTGVEIAGALAEMREHVLPRDYPDLDTSLLKIHLVQGGRRLLPAMSETASAASLKYLTQMGVDVQLNAFVVDYDDHTVKLQDGRSFKSQTIIWVCGVTGVLMATQIATGEANNIRIRIYGEKGGLEWRQMEPNTLTLKWGNRPAEVLQIGNNSFLSEQAMWNIRTPAGHPEGFIEAFANIYRNFALTVRAIKNGETPTGDCLDFPTVYDGVRGMQFIETMVAAGYNDDLKWQKWIE